MFKRHLVMDHIYPKYLRLLNLVYESPCLKKKFKMPEYHSYRLGQLVTFLRFIATIS